MRAQPAAGRYFPITPPRLLVITRHWCLTGESEPRKFRNPDGEEVESDLLLARLRPERDLTVYSLPADVDRSSGEPAITKAIEMLAPWNATPAEVDGRYRSTLVYFHNREQLRLIDERVKVRRRRFGAGEGLSSSRKPIVTNRTRTELASVKLFD
jgi:hypothetical protein